MFVLHQLEFLILWSDMTTGMFVLIQHKLVDLRLCVAPARVFDSE